MKNKIYIILVNYNSYEDSKNCIKSILESNNGIFDIKITLVDNNSKNSVKEHLRKICNEFGVKLIENEDNYGFAKANNIGIKSICTSLNAADNNYIWFLNNDTKIENSFFKILNKTLPNNNEVLYFEMRDFSNKIINDGLNYVSPLTGKYSETFKRKYIPYICGASIFLKYTENIPLWNEKFFLYYEDADYSIRLRNCGYAFINANALYYLHKVNGSSVFNPHTNRFRLQSQKKFMKRYGYNYFLYFVLKIFYYLFSFRFSELKDFINS